MLNLFQFQGFESQKSGTTSIEKVSRKPNESRRMASRDFAIHPLALENFEIRTVDVLSESNGSDEGINGWILDENLVNPLARLVASERNSCLRLGKTREHCLSKRVTSPTAAIILTMISCGMSIDFAIYALVCYSFDECKCKHKANNNAANAQCALSV